MKLPNVLFIVCTEHIHFGRKFVELFDVIRTVQIDVIRTVQILHTVIWKVLYCCLKLTEAPLML